MMLRLQQPYNMRFLFILLESFIEFDVPPRDHHVDGAWITQGVEPSKLLLNRCTAFRWGHIHIKLI